MKKKSKFLVSPYRKPNDSRRDRTFVNESQAVNYIRKNRLKRAVIIKFK